MVAGTNQKCRCAGLILVKVPPGPAAGRARIIGSPGAETPAAGNIQFPQNRIPALRDA